MKKIVHSLEEEQRKTGESDDPPMQVHLYNRKRGIGSKKEHECRDWDKRMQAELIIIPSDRITTRNSGPNVSVKSCIDEHQIIDPGRCKSFVPNPSAPSEYRLIKQYRK